MEGEFSVEGERRCGVSPRVSFVYAKTKSINKEDRRPETNTKPTWAIAKYFQLRQEPGCEGMNAIPPSMSDHREDTRSWSPSNY
jgi:hypothetical protein